MTMEDYDPRLLFWTQDEPVRNFGDLLTLMLVERALEVEMAEYLGHGKSKPVSNSTGIK